MFSEKFNEGNWKIKEGYESRGNSFSQIFDDSRDISREETVTILFRDPRTRKFFWKLDSYSCYYVEAVAFYLSIGIRTIKAHQRVSFVSWYSWKSFLRLGLYILNDRDSITAFKFTPWYFCPFSSAILLREWGRVWFDSAKPIMHFTYDKLLLYKNILSRVVRLAFINSITLTTETSISPGFQLWKSISSGTRVAL